MRALRELQQRFIENAFHTGTIAGDHILKPGLLPSDRLVQIYRNNIFITLTEALQNVFAVIEKLVGHDYFTHLAHGYIKHHPPTTGDIRVQGVHFSTYLKQHKVMETLPYLADIADFEWAIQEAYHAADAEPLDINALQQTAAEAYETLTFVLNPSLHFVQSDYPLLQIWQYNQPGAPSNASVRLDNGGGIWAVWRSGMDIAFLSLDRGGVSFLRTIQAGLPFGQACENATGADAEFNLNEFFQQCVVNQIIVDFNRTGRANP